MARKTSQPLLRIGQDVLRDYFSRKVTIRQLSDRNEEVREQLLDLHDLGAPIELGPMAYKVREYLDRRFTDDALAGLLGPAEVARLKERIPGVARKQLIVMRSEITSSDPRRPGD